ncbi:VOC family protein [Fulvimarina sp. MAC3]|uniref:VOC family protein n=1 Tax=Fulvimarina sp. MAC3 TaxID=3148887 RepID=UPI0031FE06AA
MSASDRACTCDLMRQLDHIVMPFAALSEARAFFESLGFTVAPDAQHPFGTGNACIYLADGLFIEPLARVDEDACEAADRDGNLFVRRDAAFRAEHPSAFSGLALKSDDSLKDRESLALVGLAEEATVDFERTLTLPDATTGELAFRLAFVKDFAPRAPNIFLCEVRRSATVDRGELTSHRNGATGLAGIEFATTDIEAAEAYFQAVLDGDSDEDEDGNLFFDLPNGRVTVTEVGGEGVPAFSLSAIVIRTGDLGAVRGVLSEAAVDFEAEEDYLAVTCPNGAGRIVFTG